MWSKRYSPHFSDQQLLDACLAGRVEVPDTVDLGLPDHIAECAACAARYADLARDFHRLANQGADEADALFTDERLARQRQRIARRIEHQGHRADVVLFPARGNPPPVADRRAPWQRWAAAAAIGGLAAGLGLGIALDRLGSDEGDRRPATIVARTVGAAEQALEFGRSSRSSRSSEDELLEAIDVALTSRRVPELLALDEVTPEPIAFSPRLR